MVVLNTPYGTRWLAVDHSEAIAGAFLVHVRNLRVMDSVHAIFLAQRVYTQRHSRTLCLS